VCLLLKIEKVITCVFVWLTTFFNGDVLYYC